jgi:hypothetical protein
LVETVLVEKVIDAVREDVHVLIVQDDVLSIRNVINVLQITQRDRLHTQQSVCLIYQTRLAAVFCHILAYVPLAAPVDVRLQVAVCRIRTLPDFVCDAS